MPNQSNQLSKGQVALGILMEVLTVSLAIAAPVTVGIAIFDRSRGIHDGVVIAAGVFFALSILYRIGSGLKQVYVQGINAQSQSIIR